MKTIADRGLGRMKSNRPMATISIRMPEAVVEELKEFAPLLGFSGYQPLIRSYIGEGLRRDEVALEHTQAGALRESLQRHGVSDEVIASVIAETIQRSA